MNGMRYRFFLLRALVICAIMGITSCSVFRQEKVSVPEAQPGWVTRLEYKDDALETVGFSCKMRLPEATFRSADEKARAEMANILVATVKSSIRTSVIADESLRRRNIEIIYEEVTRLYARGDIPGTVIVDRYLDPENGVVYSLARLNRSKAVKDAEMKAKLALGESKSLLDEEKLRQAIEARLRSARGELIEVTGQASITVGKPKCEDLVVAMGRAELNARSTLARQIRTSISNDVGEWINAHENRFDSDSSVHLLYKNIAQTLANVTLEGSRVMERYFGNDGSTACAKVTISKGWVAAELSDAVAPVIRSIGNAELKDEINSIIHDNLDKLIEVMPDEDAAEYQGAMELDGNSRGPTVLAVGPFSAREWWKQKVKEGARGRYFYGIGHGSAQGAADEDALNRLAKYIGVNVTSEVLQKLQSTTEKGRMTYEERIRVVSKQNLYGVSYRWHKTASAFYSVAFVPMDRVLTATEAVSRYYVASGIPGEDVAGILGQSMESARLLKSLSNAGFPVYIEQDLLLKVGLERLVLDTLDMVTIKPIHPAGTERYGIQLHTRAGQNLVNQKIIYNLVHKNGNVVNIGADFTGVDGHSTITWSGADGMSTIEVIPQFILDIEGFTGLLDTGHATERFRVSWEGKIRRDTEELIALWNDIQDRMEHTGMETHGDELKVEVWVDRENGIYYEDEDLKIHFRANQDCYLVLCNIPVDNQVRLIFPNEYQTDNLVRGGELYHIPDEDFGHEFRFPIEPPFGKERLYAFASTWSLDDFVQEIRERSGKIGSVSDMARGLQDSSHKIITKAVGVEALRSKTDLYDPSPQFAHDWCIFVSSGR